MEMKRVPVYVSYEDAQILIPIFEKIVEQAPWREARGDATAILRELERVRDIDYKGFSGKQIFLTHRQADLFESIHGTDIYLKSFGYDR